MFKLTLALTAFLFTWQVFYGQLPEQKIVPADNGSGDFFGQFISMKYPDIMISAHQKNIFGYASGALYVYRSNELPDTFSEFQMIFPSDGHIEEFFGYSVVMDDTWAITGSHHDSDAGGSSGSVFALKKENSVWLIHQKIIADDASAGDEFGKAVSLNEDELFSGAWLDDDQGSNSGSVYVFKRQNNIWRQSAKLYPDPAAPYDQFGNFMASAGDYLLVGVPENKANGPKSGCAFLFEKTDGEWKQTDRWIPSDGHEGAHFGQSVTIGENWAAVGAYKSDSYCTDCGGVYLYRKNENTWEYFTTLIPEDVKNGDHFGNAIHLEGDLLAVGAYFDDDLGANSGSVYLYHFVNDHWKLLSRINARDGQEGDAFGSDVHINAPWLAVGAYGRSQNGFFSGGAYIYKLSELLSASIQEKPDSPFKLYPTIFNSWFCWEQPEYTFDYAHFYLYASNGRLLFSGTAKPGQNCFETGHLPNGLIFYKIVTASQVQTGTLIKQ